MTTSVVFLPSTLWPTEPPVSTAVDRLRVLTARQLPGWLRSPALLLRKRGGDRRSRGAFGSSLITSLTPMNSGWLPKAI